MTINHEDLNPDALEATARAATPGPWEAGDVWVYTDPIYPDDRRLSNVLGMKFEDEERADAEHARGLRNAEHIATFDPPAVLALIARLREAEAVIEQVRAKLPGPRTFAESMSRDFAGNLWPRNVDADEIAAILATYKTTNQEEP